MLEKSMKVADCPNDLFVQLVHRAQNGLDFYVIAGLVPKIWEAMGR